MVYVYYVQHYIATGSIDITFYSISDTTSKANKNYVA